jgi:hypothetical protein
MNDTLIQVGRRTISHSELEQAVKASRSVRDVQKLLGWGMAATTTTKLGEAILKAGISQATFEYKIGAKHFERQLKQYNIAEVNQPYFDYCEKKFPKIYTEESYKNTYRNIFGNFLEFVGDQDIVKIKGEKIEQYAEGKTMRVTVIKSILKRIVLDNINNSRFNVSKKLLFVLLDDGKMKK